MSITESREVTDNLNTEKEIKRKRRIKKLDLHMKVLHERIKALEEKELSMNDLQDESDYTLCEKYKERLVLIHKMYCKLSKEDAKLGRQSEKEFIFEDTPYPRINRTVARLINKHHYFPDYCDVVELVSKCNEKFKMNFNKSKVLSLSERVFVRVGELLKRRRLKDYKEEFGCHLTDHIPNEEDPANKDESLRRRLDENRKVAHKNLNQVFSTFANKEKVDNMEDGNNDEEDDNEDEEEEEEEETVGKKKKMDFDDSGLIIIDDESDDTSSILDPKPISDSSENKIKKESSLPPEKTKRDVSLIHTTTKCQGSLSNVGVECDDLNDKAVVNAGASGSTCKATTSRTLFVSLESLVDEASDTSDDDEDDDDDEEEDGEEDGEGEVDGGFNIEDSKLCCFTKSFSQNSEKNSEEDEKEEEEKKEEDRIVRKIKVDGNWCKQDVLKNSKMEEEINALINVAKVGNKLILLDDKTLIESCFVLMPKLKMDMLNILLKKQKESLLNDQNKSPWAEKRKVEEDDEEEEEVDRKRFRSSVDAPKALHVEESTSKWTNSPCKTYSIKTSVQSDDSKTSVSVTKPPHTNSSNFNVDTVTSSPVSSRHLSFPHKPSNHVSHNHDRTPPCDKNDKGDQSDITIIKSFASKHKDFSSTTSSSTAAPRVSTPTNIVSNSFKNLTCATSVINIDDISQSCLSSNTSLVVIDSDSHPATHMRTTVDVSEREVNRGKENGGTCELWKGRRVIGEIDYCEPHSSKKISPKGKMISLKSISSDQSGKEQPVQHGVNDFCPSHQVLLNKVGRSNIGEVEGASKDQVSKQADNHEDSNSDKNVIVLVDDDESREVPISQSSQILPPKITSPHKSKIMYRGENTPVSYPTNNFSSNLSVNSDARKEIMEGNQAGNNAHFKRSQVFAKIPSHTSVPYNRPRKKKGAFPGFKLTPKLRKEIQKVSAIVFKQNNPNYQRTMPLPRSQIQPHSQSSHRPSQQYSPKKGHLKPNSHPNKTKFYQNHNSFHQKHNNLHQTQRIPYQTQTIQPKSNPIQTQTNQNHTQTNSHNTQTNPHHTQSNYTETNNNYENSISQHLTPQKKRLPTKMIKNGTPHNHHHHPSSTSSKDANSFYINEGDNISTPKQRTISSLNHITHQAKKKNSHNKISNLLNSLNQKTGGRDDFMSENRDAHKNKILINNNNLLNSVRYNDNPVKCSSDINHSTKTSNQNSSALFKQFNGKINNKRPEDRLKNKPSTSRTLNLNDKKVSSHTIPTLTTSHNFPTPVTKTCISDDDIVMIYESPKCSKAPAVTSTASLIVVKPTDHVVCSPSRHISVTSPASSALTTLQKTFKQLSSPSSHSKLHSKSLPTTTPSLLHHHQLQQPQRHGSRGFVLTSALSTTTTTTTIVQVRTLQEVSYDVAQNSGDFQSNTDGSINNINYNNRNSSHNANNNKEFTKSKTLKVIDNKNDVTTIKDDSNDCIIYDIETKKTSCISQIQSISKGTRNTNQTSSTKSSQNIFQRLQVNQNTCSSAYSEASSRILMTNTNVESAFSCSSAQAIVIKSVESHHQSVGSVIDKRNNSNEITILD